MYKYTDHASKMMAAREIAEQEVQAAIEKGELEFTRIDEKGRGAEYTNSIELKDNFPRKIMVGWTYDKDDILILTVYEVKRKWR
ncbi:MAG: DUF4258 domain-containing protein [Candidatus Methanoperedens sp.]|nr:DUF4258 domain-containing protein [Candidatus Methanoperedens sp.]